MKNCVCLWQIFNFQKQISMAGNLENIGKQLRRRSAES